MSFSSFLFHSVDEKNVFPLSSFVFFLRKLIFNHANKKQVQKSWDCPSQHKKPHFDNTTCVQLPWRNFAIRNLLSLNYGRQFSYFQKNKTQFSTFTIHALIKRYTSREIDL